MIKEKKNKKQREYRDKNNNLCTKHYEKTKQGFLMRVFRNMKSRVTGVQKKKYHLYDGIKIIFTKEEFYKWSLNNNDFHSLFDKWKQSNYDRKLAPSADRINSDLHYSFDNIRWVTNSENCRNVRHAMGEEHKTSVLNNNIVIDARNRNKKGESIYKIAKELDIYYWTLWHAVTRRTWKHIK